MNTKERILPLVALKERTGLRRSTIYLKVQQGQFPKTITLGLRSRGQGLPKRAVARRVMSTMRAE